MLSKGANVDIATGRPIDEVKAGQAEAKQREEEAGLKRKAVYAGLLSTEPGKIIVDLIVEQLKNRVRTLAENDPEAGALVRLLKDFGVKENIAEAAMEQLARRYLRKENMQDEREA